MSYEFGKRLQELRSMRGLSVKYVIQALGVSRSTYSGWENGSAIHRVEFYPKLAKVLNVSVSELFNDKMEPSSNIKSSYGDDLILSICRRLVRSINEHPQDE